MSSDSEVKVAPVPLPHTYEWYLTLPNVSDSKDLASNVYSVQTFVNNRANFVVGESIYVRINLFDGHGRGLRVGGDKLRIWLTDPASGSNVNGDVIDHDDGTYTGVVRALWRGRAKVKTSIAFTKEHIGIVLNSIEKYGIHQRVNIIASYRKDTKVATAFCSVKPDVRGLTMCNLTKQNYGLPWYCGRPDKASLTCDDWTHTSSVNTNLANSTGNKICRSHKHLILKGALRVNIIGDTDSVTSDSVSCHLRSKSSTWSEPSPVGFYFRRKWRTLRCNNSFDSSVASYRKCLRGHRIVFLGDSNIASWFNHIKKVLAMVSPPNMNYNIKIDKAHHRDLNISMMWAPHAMPHFVGVRWWPRKSQKSVSWHLDRIPASDHVIVVIHLYTHFMRALPGVFRLHVRDSVNGLTRLFKRLPHVKVFIKGPHSFTYFAMLTPIDYIRRLQEKIYYEEFASLHDKIVYLSEWDITTGSENVNVHPGTLTLTEMVNTFMSYLCG